ncbi:MAG: nuclear transport factor 2 family protein [Saprospiraceae bacterium]|nr:nuclear transport factor 2 family protein [Saprospiraceae bacterium]
MKYYILLICLFVAIVSIPAQAGLSVVNEANPGGGLAASDLEVLLMRDRDCSEAANKSAMEHLWACWDDDAMLLGPGGTLTGIAEIKEFTIAVRKDPRFSISWSVQDGELSPDGQMGYTQGVGTITRSGDDGKAVSMTNPYLCVWKKDREGTWKIIIEK